MVDLESGLGRRSLELDDARTVAARPSATASPIASARRALEDRRRWTSAHKRKELGVTAVFNRVDTCAAEFESFTPYLYSSYESRMRSRSVRSQEGHDSGQRAEPHRPGNRVRLLLLPRLVRAAGIRHRVDHGQLQSGDRLDRLRHQRPPLFRAADARRSAEHLRHREARRRDRPVRRADAAEPGACR